jgi:putative two-component system response regulator
VLLKPAALTAEERSLMRAHTEIGDHLLEPLELLAAVRPIVRHHHERWDGLGYPDGLKGEAIPLGARIMAVADAVDAMSASRVYRQALPESEIVHELERGRGSQWDPAIVDLILELIESGAVSLSRDGLEIPEPSPGGAVLRFPGPRARRARRKHLGEAAQ